jgi:hypothetical protein
MWKSSSRLSLLISAILSCTTAPAYFTAALSASRCACKTRICPHVIQTKAQSQQSSAVEAIRIAILFRVLPNLSAITFATPAMEAAQILEGRPFWL